MKNLRLLSDRLVNFRCRNSLGLTDPHYVLLYMWGNFLISHPLNEKNEPIGQALPIKIQPSYITIY